MRRGRPAMVVSDNGTELTGMAVLRWCVQARIEWHYIAPGKPTQKRLRRELQRSAARRTAQRDAVHVARPGPRPAGGLAERLQRGPTTQLARRPDTQRVRRSQRSGARNGAGRCAMWAPRPDPLLRRARWAQMSSGLFPLLNELWGSGHSRRKSGGAAPLGGLEINPRQLIAGRALEYLPRALLRSRACAFRRQLHGGVTLAA